MKFLNLLLIFFLLLPNSFMANSDISTSSELNNVTEKLDNVNKDLKFVNEELDKLIEEQYYLNKRLNLIYDREETKKQELIITNIELGKLRNETFNIENELDLRKNLFKERVNLLYKENQKQTPSILEVILNSEGFGDFINRLNAYQTIVEVDNKIISDYTSLVSELENKEEKAEKVIEKINKLMEELEIILIEVNKMILEKERIEDQLKAKKYDLSKRHSELSSKKVKLEDGLNKNSLEQKLNDVTVNEINNKDLNKLIEEKANKYNIPVSLLKGIIQQESGFNTNAVNINKNGSVDRGLMQINSGTAPGLARQIGIEYKVGIEFIPEISLEMGSKYISDYVHMDRGLHFALTNYNRGPFGAKRWYQSNGTYETDYSRKVIAYKEAFDK